MTLLITLLFTLLAGIANAYMDMCKEFQLSKWKDLTEDFWWFRWANDDYSWKNKWKLVNDTLITNHVWPWYYFKLYKPDYVERFPLSSTMLVFITDGWHFFQMLMWSFITLAIAVNEPIKFINNAEVSIFWNIILNFIIIRLVTGIGFNIFYEKVLKKK